MATQGLKNATEQSTLENKPGSLRRGAAGRAAALRRAPSDSDCSGETASLSADSGERRPAPPPPRSGKTRSRRRGSEWEVLEGLKDGQRFERRPEVFNGYLHKKRKWPLKGWHKRFFVVDGGILVYARSPSDVARGRLHGSLDVGLSVISAKPRRRRIDIDADEFIYHLRAKTPDVFRTWLNVLKAHRLYRQHLLTFGAREPVPKIHAPLDELPPTDASSRISQSSSQSFSSMSTFPGPPLPLASSPTFRLRARGGSLGEPSHNTLRNWFTRKSSEVIPAIDLLDEFDNVIKPGSMCSMCCVKKRIENNKLQNDSPYRSTDDNQIRSGHENRTSKAPEINLNAYRQKSKNPQLNSPTAVSNNATIESSLLGEYTINSLPRSKLSHLSVTRNPLISLQSYCKEKSPTLFGDNTHAAMFFFGRKKRSPILVEEQQWIMRRSKKSTNVTKYRNSSAEPLLKRPLSKCMLLGQYKSGSKRKMEFGNNRSIICDLLKNDVIGIKDVPLKMNKSIQDILSRDNKSVQVITSSSNYDIVTEKLLLTLFDFHSRHPHIDMSTSTDQSAFGEVKFYVHEAVKELYAIQLNQCTSQPVQFLFKSLLEYWLKNTESSLRDTLKETRSVEQSNHCFTKDEQLSSEYIHSSTKETQVFENYIKRAPKDKTPQSDSPKPAQILKIVEKLPVLKPPENPDTESFEKERRIQELERLLKNTVYICETVTDEDIKITKTLIQNLDTYPKKNVLYKSSNRESDSSTEIPKIQETINRLISDTDLPPEMAKDFLKLYLDMLLQKSSRSETSTSQSSDASKPFRNMGDGLPFSDVQAEAVQKKVSKSITTTTYDKVDKPSFDGDDQNQNTSIDPGQLYLKEILDKLTFMFTKVQKIDANTQQNVRDINFDEKKNPIFNEEVKVKKEFETQDLIFENKEENSVVIDLCKYDVDHIAMRNDCASEGMLSIRIKLKEKPSDFGEGKRKNLDLKFSNHQPKAMQGKPIPWAVHLPANVSTEDNTSINHLINNSKPFIDYDPNYPTDKMDLRPYLSSEATSKANCRFSNDSDNSFDMSLQSNNNSRALPSSKTSLDGYDDAQCYILSSLRKGVHERNLSETRMLRLKDMNDAVKSRVRPQNRPRRNTDHSLPVFSNSPPKIIDEKFILLLLENLMLLSKNIPEIYKDINSLYLKLRKRHEKIIKNSTFAPGLSLLGKMYDEESSQNLHRAMFDGVTQFDTPSFPDDKHERVKTAVQIAVNTSILLHAIPDVLDKALSVYKLCNHLTHFEVQTEPNTEKKQIKYKTSMTKFHNNKSIAAQTSFRRIDWLENEPLVTKERAISIQNWPRRLLKENAMSTSLFDSDYLAKGVDITKTDLKVTISAERLPSYQKRQSLETRQDLIKEMKLFTDSCKVSTHAQTERKNIIDWQEDEPLVTKERSISIQNWPRRLLKENAMSTTINSLFDTYYLAKGLHMTKTDLKVTISAERFPSYQKRQSLETRQDLIKEMKLFTDSCKVSSLSQTERKNMRQKNSFDGSLKVFEVLTKNGFIMSRSYSKSDSNVASSTYKSDDMKTLYRCSSNPSISSVLINPTAAPIRGPQAGFVSGTPGGRLASWITESGGPLESASRELGQAQLSVQQLQRLLEALELQQQLHHDTDVSLEGASPNVKKDRRKFGLRKKKSSTKCASVELAPHALDVTGSHMALSTLTAPPSPGGGASSMPNSAASLPIACAAARPQSLPGAEALGTGGPASITSLTPDHQLREDFTVLAKDLVASLKSVVSTLVCERGRLRAAMDAADAPVAPGAAVVAALRTNLSSALQQNSELRSRLSRIHDASDLAEISSVGNNSETQVRPFPQSLSYSSSCVSASEFFDAEEHEDELKPAEIIATDEAGVIELDGDSSSEAGSLSSEEGSGSSDNSDGGRSAVIPADRAPLQNGAEQKTSRRMRLPCPRPTPASPSLWNLLYKNIGKDLSQISMPVTINEPLNMLQRLCEELEYSELLDSASECNNEIDRMALIAAFAVSAYAASAHRAASKPFNPLLAETYECIRPDKDFRFIAEQVSHHPPISACHAESPRWSFWQEARIKTKFWGKSMEFQPAGRVHVRLTRTGDHYSWNKVTTCVHNLFGGQRWVDQYGDMHIVSHGTNIKCRLNFLKASSWSSGRHEVRGAVSVGSASRVQLTGRWSEGLSSGERALWRPGAMPSDYELYYGFTRFAMQLNELEPGMREMLPSTDTRLRPDQRALEEGDVDAAEQFKHQLEQAQRERRHDNQEHRPTWFRKTVEDGEETWVFTGEYWKAREAGFSEAPRLW